jgi:2-polyprenyl-6-methoxyphenol hydroxylase-like FAD-dependent oxidoreductase
MSLPRTTDVLIVGGGPAGAATATFLARTGLDVQLIDRAHFPRPKPCAEYLSPEASRVLSALGVLEAVEGAGAAQLTGMRVHAPNGHTIDGTFVAAHGFRGFRDRGLALRREVLDALLLDTARAAGVAVHEGVTLESLTRSTRGYTLGVRHGGTTETRYAAFVVGADGLRSRVARHLGLARRARWPRRLALVAHWRGVAGMAGVGEMHVRSDGYLGLAEVGHGLTNVALVVPASQAKSAAGDADGFVRTWLARHPALSARFAHAERVSPVRATGPFASHARRAWAPDAALVGDAADFFDPFTGEGIYAALRGGELLAPFVRDAVRADSPDAATRALRAYERARREAFAGKWRVERLIGLAVGVPALMNHAARVLSRRADLADLLIGVTGDFVPAREVLRPRVLWRLMVPPLRS